MLSLILAFMLTMGGSPAVSVSPVNSIGPESGVSHDITGKPRLGEFLRIYPVETKPNAGNPRLVLNLSFQYKKSPLINLNQAFGMNPVNFDDPFGTVVNSELVRRYNSIMAAENEVRSKYHELRNSGFSHADAYQQLINLNYVTHSGFYEDKIFEFALSMSTLYGKAKMRKFVKKRPAAETVGDFSAGFGDKASKGLFDITWRALTHTKPPKNVVPTKIYREALQKVLDLDDIKDMVDYDSPAYEMGEYTWDGTVITTCVLQSTYCSSTLMTGESGEVLNLPYTGTINTWNEFQTVTSGQFSSRTDAAKAWELYKARNCITTGVLRNQAAKEAFLKQLAASGKAPKWMNQWLSKGRVPPGYEVDHIVPLSIGGQDIPSNMRLLDKAFHDLHHSPGFYRPWED
jgi:hypothetical protein